MRQTSSSLICFVSANENQDGLGNSADPLKATKYELVTHALRPWYHVWRGLGTFTCKDGGHRGC